MKIFKFFTFFLVLAILAAFLPQGGALALESPAVDATACVLADSDTGAVYYEHNADVRIYPASTTKVMTVLLALEAVSRGEFSLAEPVTASATSHDGLDSDGSTQNILPGETMPLGDLLYCAMVSSANEACNIIAEHVAGSVSAFVTRMNARAVELGCKDTHFTNTHGLPDGNHYTTARDLYLITNAALQNETFVTICCTVEKTVAATNFSEARKLVTTNNLINPDKSSYYCSYAQGVKTGSTNAAGYCLISSADRNGIHIISVVMGAQATPNSDGSYTIQSFTETKRLFEWFYKNYSYQEVLGTSELIDEVPVAMGDDADSVIVRPREALTVLLTSDQKPEDFKREVVIYSAQEGAERLTAPVKAGDVLGELTLSLDGKSWGPIELVANTGVDLSKTAYIRARVAAALGQGWVKTVFWCLVALFALYAAFVVRYNIVRRRRRRAYYAEHPELTEEQSDKKER